MTIFHTNKKALHDYTVLESYEAGIMLTGAEVKSVRLGSVSLKGAYVVPHYVPGNLPEMSLINCHISAYQKAHSSHGSPPERTRKLLLKRREIQSIIGKLKQKGLTLVPIKMYNNGSKIKVELALVKGKKKYDKRQEIKKREVEKKIREVIKLRR